MAEKNKKTNNDESILELAKSRFKISEDAEQTIRDEALDDIKFRAGEQWPKEVEQERKSDHRPCLTINRIPQFIRQVTNDQRQNRPSLKVHPVDDGADLDTAKVIQGIIRHIEYDSNADVAIDTAFEGAATKGFGWFRVITEYESPTSFKQAIKIKKIKNDLLVRPDPFYTEPDGSDMNFCQIFEDVSKEEYIRLYGESKLSKDLHSWTNYTATSDGWVTDSSVRVAEYYYKDYETVDRILLSNGTELDRSDLTDEEYQFLKDNKSKPDALFIEKERTCRVPKIKWCLHNGIEILEKREWPGSWIPVIPVLGDELIVDGKRILEGVIRHAKDSQRMYNYWASTETETIALAPRAPYIAAEGQIPKEYAPFWQSANKKNFSYLVYKPTDHNGQVLPAPQRNSFEPPVQAVSMARAQASEDLKATTGIYDAALGARSNETSGKAILSRTAQAQTSNFHFIDNLTRSLRHLGRILVEIIPIIYDTAQAIRIIGDDGQAEVIKLYQDFEYKGKVRTFDLSKGKYDLTVDTGPSFQTKRQEAVQSILELSRANPNVLGVAGDLLVSNMDIPLAKEIGERIKKTIPPNILGDDSQEQQIPPQVQAQMQQSQMQMQQMSQMIEELTKKLEEANEREKTKMIELESKERIEVMKIEADIKKEMFKANAAASQEIMYAELEQIKNRLAMLDVYQDFDSNEQESDQHEFEQQTQMPTNGPQSLGQNDME